MFKRLEEVSLRYDEVLKNLASEEIYHNPVLLKKLSQEKASLEDLVTTYLEYKKSKKSLEESKSILDIENDEELRSLAKEEIKYLENTIPQIEEKLKELMVPKDPLDQKDILLEIRAGAGGVEASLFAQEVARMYQNFVKTLGFKQEIISYSEAEEGLKEIILSIKGKGVYGALKYESGVHRVQRVPKTESQGRIHTSTITVAVMPEADEVEFKLDLNDVRIDVYRASGNGGQSVNTTDSAVRVTHLPTGTVVAIQDEKSQIKNKDKALKILTNKIYTKMIEEAKDKESALRKDLVGSGDRSERIRTYNFPQGRLTDHRINLTLYSLESIMEGNLAEVIQPLNTFFQAEKLKYST